MFCQHCGAEATEGQVFCASCGARLDEEVVVTTATANHVPTQSKCWTVFANIGFGLGLGSLILFWVYTLSVCTAPIGLVFSILGTKSNTSGGRAKSGIVLSTIALALSIIVWIIIIAALLETSLYY